MRNDVVPEPVAPRAGVPVDPEPEVEAAGEAEDGLPVVPEVVARGLPVPPAEPEECEPTAPLGTEAEGAETDLAGVDAEGTVAEGTVPTGVCTGGVVAAGVVTRGVVTEGVLAVGVVTEGVVTRGGVTDGVVATGVDTEGAVADGVVTEGRATARVTVAALGVGVVVGTSAAVPASGWATRTPRAADTTPTTKRRCFPMAPVTTATRRTCRFPQRPPERVGGGHPDGGPDLLGWRSATPDFGRGFSDPRPPRPRRR